jgi:hypothetical protein
MCSVLSARGLMVWLGEGPLGGGVLLVHQGYELVFRIEGPRYEFEILSDRLAWLLGWPLLCASATSY